MPKGIVFLESIVDSSGKKTSFNDAVRYGWISGGFKLNSSNEVVLGNNLFLDQGRQLVAYCMGNRSPASDYSIKKFGVGTGTMPANVADTSLRSPVLLNSGLYTGNINGIDFIEPFVMRVAFTLGVNDANGYLLTELGLFSGNGTLVAKRVSSVGINKTSDFSPTLVWRIRF